MKKIFALAIFLLGAQSLSARDRQSFDKGWLFTLADSAVMSKSDYSDRHWRSLNLPHDWAIEGDFSPSNPSGAGGGACCDAEGQGLPICGGGPCQVPWHWQV